MGTITDADPDMVYRKLECSERWGKKTREVADARFKDLIKANKCC